MKTNIATTREQSARLLQCGVPAESADMCYDSGALSLMDYDSAVHERDSRRETYEVVPAWSLNSLLGLLPDIITYGGYQWGMFMTKLSKDSVCISYARWDNFNSTIGHLSGNAIEACVKAIEWLTANGYQLNGIEKGGEDV